MRREYQDAILRMRTANEAVWRGFNNNLVQTVDHVLEAYEPASASERKAILKQCRQGADRMWNGGDWPSALGLAIACLNVESRDQHSR